MSDNRFSKRRSGKVQRFRPAGGLKRQPKNLKIKGDGREEMVGSRMMDEPVYESSRHEKDISTSENKAFGIKPKKEVKDTTTKKVKATVKQKPRKLGDKIKQAAAKVINKVKNLLQGEKSDKIIVINAESLETRVAVIEKGKLEEFNIERKNQERIVASIYKGKVRNLEDKLAAAFVDIGIEKNAFLHYWDIVPGSLDNQYEVVERKRKSKNRSTSRIYRKDIPKKYPVGSDIVVQVTKGPIGTKGPRVTTHLAIPGRFLVLLPNTEQCGISKKIQDPQERARLRDIIRSLDLPDNIGVIVRTAGEGQRKAYFIRDLAILMEEWKQLHKKIESENSPVCVFREPDLIERTVRDFLTDDVGEIIVDDANEFDRVKQGVGNVSRRSTSKVKQYKEARSVFDHYNVTRQIENTFSRKVFLKSGGCIIIDETEALVAIDVNTGGHKGGKDQESTILKVNLESAEEICRQLRLRNIGGLIVLDFIDMRAAGDRNEVFKRMRNCLKRDRARTHILPISQLGLMEMTRQRHSESVQSTVYDDCTNCSGRGRIKSTLTMSVEIQRKLDEILKKRKPDEDMNFELRIVVNPIVLDRLRKEDEDLLINMEKKYLAKLSFREEPKLHAEQFKIFNGLNNQELVSVGERENGD